MSSSKPINLSGSVETITEFFGYAVNSILYQRAVYPSEEFTRKSKYGLGLWLTSNNQLETYIKNILTQVRKWLIKGEVEKLVLVLAGLDTRKNLERWDFSIETRLPSENQPIKEKSESSVVTEIQALMRQIAASVSFLPVNYNEEVSCEILVHTKKGLEVPIEWEESVPRLIERAQNVQLRNIDTGYHKVASQVAYQYDENLV